VKYYQLASKQILELDEGLPQTIKRKFGAVPLVEAEADADHAAGTILLAADGNSATLYVAPAPYWVSKLKLRRALRAAGLELAYDAFLAANPIHQADLAAANELLSTDPLLVSAVPQLAALAGIPAPHAWAIISACRKDTEP
jgi:hypothetical protein